MSTGSGQIQKSLNLLGSNLSFTQAIDGLAMFLAKRIKEELAIQVFDKIKNRLNSKDSLIEELKVILPLTANFLINITPQEYPGVLNSLKEKIELDLKDLLHNIPNLQNTRRFTKLLKKNPDLELAFLGIHFIDDLTKTKSPTEIIFILEESALIQKLSIRYPDFVNGVKLAALFTYAITEQSGDSRSFIHPEEWDKYKGNKDFYNVFLGFIEVQNKKYYHIKFGTDSLNTKLIALAHAEDVLEDLFVEAKDILRQAQNIGDEINVLQQGKKQNGNISADSVAHLLNTSITFLDSVFSFANSLAIKINGNAPDLRSKSDYYVTMTRTAVSLYADLGEKRYYNALQNAINLFDKIKVFKRTQLLKLLKQTMEANQTGVSATLNTLITQPGNAVSGNVRRAIGAFQQNQAAAINAVSTEIDSLSRLPPDAEILKILNLVVAVAKAKSADDFEKAIEAIVLPAGSATVKRESLVNLSLNAYAGFFGGVERIYNGNFANDATSNATNFAFTAPIGVAGSLSNKKNGSWTLFVSIIDIGAFTSVRIGDNNSQLPEITFQNIFTPGAQLIYGIPKSAFSIAGGAQFGPSLRKVSYNNGSSTLVTEDKSAFRYGISLLIDIPLLNFYTKSKAYRK